MIKSCRDTVLLEIKSRQVLFIIQCFGEYDKYCRHFMADNTGNIIPIYLFSTKMHVGEINLTSFQHF